MLRRRRRSRGAGARLPPGAVKGVEVRLLEAHKDFDREFRGDTVHPSTLEILDSLGLADRLLELPHSKVRQGIIQTATGSFPFADFSRPRHEVPLHHADPPGRFPRIHGRRGRPISRVRAGHGRQRQGTHRARRAHRGGPLPVARRLARGAGPADGRLRRPVLARPRTWPASSRSSPRRRWTCSGSACPATAEDPTTPRSASASVRGRLLRPAGTPRPLADRLRHPQGRLPGPPRRGLEALRAVARRS